MFFETLRIEGIPIDMYVGSGYDCHMTMRGM